MATRPRYLVYKKDNNGKLWLVDDFASRETSTYVMKSIPNLRTHIRTFGYCDGNGYRAIPYQTRSHDHETESESSA